MNTIKYLKILKIKEWLNHYGVENYTINSDLTIDVNGSVNLDKKGLTNFPDYIKFNKVPGTFYCQHNKLTSLEGAPDHVGCNFYCDHNKLTSLKGAPDHVGRFFYCSNNKLTSLEGAPNYVGGTFDCGHNKLTSLKGAPNYIGGFFYCSFNKLTSLEGAPDHVGHNFYCHENVEENLQLPKGTTVKGKFYKIL